jgi:hypothetical protein
MKTTRAVLNFVSLLTIAIMAASALAAPFGSEGRLDEAPMGSHISATPEEAHARREELKRLKADAAKGIKTPLKSAFAKELGFGRQSLLAARDYVDRLNEAELLELDGTNTTDKTTTRKNAVSIRAHLVSQINDKIRKIDAIIDGNALVLKRDQTVSKAQMFIVGASNSAFHKVATQISVKELGAAKVGRTLFSAIEKFATAPVLKSATFAAKGGVAAIALTAVDIVGAAEAKDALSVRMESPRETAESVRSANLQDFAEKDWAAPSAAASASPGKTGR